MKVKSFLSSKATSIETLKKDLQELAEKSTPANIELPIIVVNDEGLKELVKVLNENSKEELILAEEDVKIPSHVGTMYGHSVFKEEDSTIPFRILVVTPLIIQTEWVEGK